MPQVLSFSTTAFLLAIAFCLVIGLISWKFSSAKNAHNRMLALYFFVLSYANFIAFLLYSGLMVYSPWFHFYRTGVGSALAIMPFSFFYFRMVIRKSKFQLRDLLHFLPVLFFLIDYTPVYLLSTPEKLLMVKSDVAAADKGQQFMNGWIRPHIDWMLVLIVQVAIYWLLQIRLLVSMVKMKQAAEMLRQNKALFRWLIIMCVVQTIYFVPYYVKELLGSSFRDPAMAYTSISAGTLLLAVLLLLNPEILYGLKGIIVDGPALDGFIEQGERNESGPLIANEDPIGQAQSDIKTEGGREKNTEYLPQEKINLIRKKIEEVFGAQQPYLNKGYSIRDLSVATGFQSYLLSAVINQAYGKRFTEFINDHRINYACALIESGSAKVLTLEALADTCGFSNRNSFTSAFKRVTGKTPSAYLKQFGD